MHHSIVQARIDALMAAPPEAAPQPAAAQPSVAAALQGQRRCAERTIIHLDMDCFFASIAMQARHGWHIRCLLQCLKILSPEVPAGRHRQPVVVLLQGHPSFRGKPLCVCHSNSAVGSAEVSSANYEARAFGVRAGMSMSRAKQQCPHLLVLPYEVRHSSEAQSSQPGRSATSCRSCCSHLQSEILSDVFDALPFAMLQFDKYEEASEAVYKILLKHTAAVQPISCDEAYLDVSGLGDPTAISAAIRAEVRRMLMFAMPCNRRSNFERICRVLCVSRVPYTGALFVNDCDCLPKCTPQVEAATGCTASAGIGPNMLLARLATKRAKPDGIFRYAANEAQAAIAALPLADLPGVGWCAPGVHLLHTAEMSSTGWQHTLDVKYICLVLLDSFMQSQCEGPPAAGRCSSAWRSWDSQLRPMSAWPPRSACRYRCLLQSWPSTGSHMSQHRP